MRTRPSLSIVVLALLAVAPAVRVFAQAAAPEASSPPAAPAVPPAAPEVTPPPAEVPPPDAASPAVPAAPLADKPAAAEPAVVAAPADAGAVTKGTDASGRDTLSVDFPDEDIRNILRNVSDLFELNIIMPETLQGKTTIKLRDVTWRQIFQNVLDPVGYTYVEDGNIIKIVSKESLNEEPVTTEVFLINYARAADILPTISSLVDTSRGRIVVDARSNSLVITERPTRLSRIRPIIEQLDRATDQVMIESKFVEVTDRDVKNIGVNWSSLANYQLSVGPESGQPLGTFNRGRGQEASRGVDSSNGTTNSNTTGTNTTNGQTASSTNTTTVTSTGGSPTSTATTSVNSTINNTATTTGATTESVSNALNFLNNVVNTGDTARTISAVFNASEFRLILSALRTQNDVKIVSNPTIVTLNNSEATINVGSEDPLPNYTYNQERGSFEVSGFNYKPIGIILKVTPQVNTRGFIKLTLAPEVSQKNGEVTFGGAGGATIPILATRKVSTVVSLKDGFTMGIGGLLTTSSTKGGTRVPVLGSVPVLGRLFRSDTTESQVTNLIIFITAKTISADGAPLEQVFESERVRQLRITPEDLPGYRDGTTPFAAPEAEPKSGIRIGSAKKAK